MKYFLYTILIIIILNGCNASSGNNDMASYNIKYYYKTGDVISMNYTFIYASSDSIAYEMACDTFLNRVNRFMDTASLTNRSNIIPVTFDIEKTLDKSNLLSKRRKNSIYINVNSKNEYRNIDTARLEKYMNIAPEKPPVIIIKSWITHNSINDPEANITIKNNSKKKMDGIKVGIYCYNNFGDKITYGFSDYFNGISQDKLSPGRSDTYTWTFSLFDNTTKIMPFIREVHFTDGAKWVYDSD